MNETIGKRVELLIYEKGFLSIRQFAEYLKRCEPENYVTEDTISNVIKGKPTKTSTLWVIARTLGVSLECLVGDTMPLVDNYLFGEVKERKEECEKEGKGNDKHIINDLEIVKALYDTGKRVYPADIGNLYDKYGYRITTLAEMSIYFPLCSMRNIMEVIYRISGEIEGYEQYVLNQYRWLYDTIPDIPAKRYADYKVIQMRLASREKLSAEESKLLLEQQDYEESEQMECDYEQYQRIIEAFHQLYKNDVMQIILRSTAPEIYEENEKVFIKTSQMLV